jgi:hypothetical protein
MRICSGKDSEGNRLIQRIEAAGENGTSGE